MSTIPASTIVNVIPGVIAAGGSALNLSGLVLDSNPRVPIGVIQTFTTQLGVQNYFGVGSKEASIAAVYFSGYLNSFQLPAQLNFAQYNPFAVSAFLRGGPVTLAQIQ